MLKLEKIEFGGIKGSVLSGQVAALFEEFNGFFRVFSELKYDPLDPINEVWCFWVKLSRTNDGSY